MFGHQFDISFRTSLSTERKAIRHIGCCNGGPRHHKHIRRLLLLDLHEYTIWQRLTLPLEFEDAIASSAVACIVVFTNVIFRRKLKMNMRFSGTEKIVNYFIADTLNRVKIEFIPWTMDDGGDGGGLLLLLSAPSPSLSFYSF